jgi:hypothetical protein
MLILVSCVLSLVMAFFYKSVVWLMRVKFGLTVSEAYTHLVVLPIIVIVVIMVGPWLTVYLGVG